MVSTPTGPRGSYKGKEVEERLELELVELESGGGVGLVTELESLSLIWIGNSMNSPVVSTDCNWRAREEIGDEGV